MEKLPVLNIKEFVEDSNVFYVNRLPDHLQKHHFIHHPHKHDFFLCVLFTKGSGTHEVDFKTYKVKPGSVFFLSPGQMHNWKLSPGTDGYILFHTKEFYDINYQNRQVKDFPFYTSIYNSPVLNAQPKNLTEVETLYEMMITEFNSTLPLQSSKLASLTDLVYINLSRLYISLKSKIENAGYLIKLRKLESLIDSHFKENKSPSYFADLMHMTNKHLNRIAKETLNKTVSEMIADRIILEAKRMLIHHKFSVSQVADALGFVDHSYFNRYFKKHTKLRPLEFAKKYKV